MKRQAFNPYLPDYEYIPDGEPYVIGDRVYVYGSHDRFGGTAFCMNDYVCWSAPVGDLGDWRCEGAIYRKEQDPDYQPGNCMYAPDITPGPDGRYYLYYTLDMTGTMAVAVAEEPAGPFSYLGRVHYGNGAVVGAEPKDIYQFDPGVLYDEDGRIWLYSGFSPRVGPMSKQRFGEHRMEGAYCMELEKDMLTVKGEPSCIIPGIASAQGTEYEAHPFFEASSIRKIGKRYYFVYSSVWSHELCYAVSTHPDGGFHAGGPIVSNGDIGLKDWSMERAANYIGNNHGGMVQIQGQWYIFYHRQTNFHSFSRQGCAEPIRILPDGSIPQVEMTSCGLNGGDLAGSGRYLAAIACNLYSAAGASYMDRAARHRQEHPVLTQTGEDRECDGDQYIANMRKGAVAGFKYFDLRGTEKVSIEVRGAGGRMLVKNETEGKKIGEICFGPSDAWQRCDGILEGGREHSALFFEADTEGAVDFGSFTLS